MGHVSSRGGWHTSCCDVLGTASGRREGPTCMELRTVIVDDEPLARQRLHDLLAAEPEVEVVADCADGAEAVTTIRRLAPDLVILDIQMPEQDGFAVIAEIGPESMPPVIF